MLLEIEQADQIEEPGALRDRVGRIVGEGDDTALSVETRCAFDLKPEGALAPNLRHDEVAMVDVGLHAGRDEVAVGAGQDLCLDHQLNEGSECSALEHPDQVSR